MSSDVTKRALSAGLGVGALALLARRASADTPFSSFAFPATGAPTARTLPDRLAELKNVKDFGAKGNGTTDDTSAIQAAVNSGQQPPSTVGGTWDTGVIYFPPGTYKVTAPITMNTQADEFNAHFLGSGLGSHIVGAMSDFIFKRGPGLPLGGNTGIVTFEKLKISGYGCILWQATVGLAVRDCLIEGTKGVHTYHEIYPACVIDNCVFRGDNNNPNNLAIFGLVNVNNCSITGCYEGIRVKYGATIRSCDIEQNRLAIVVGADENNNDFTSAVVVEGCGFEGNGIGIDVRTATTSMISACSFQGHSWSPGPPDNPNHGSVGAMRIRYISDSVIQAISTGGDWVGPVINLLAPVGRTVMMGIEAHADSGTPPLWSANPGGYTFIACNNP